VVEGKAVKYFSEVITCHNCHYTRGYMDWYESEETKILYCTQDCYLSKEKNNASTRG
jgi:hypothetical protein